MDKNERPVPEALIDEYRYALVDDPWWYECIVDNWVERMEHRGVTIETARDRPKVYWDQYFNMEIAAYIGPFGWESVIEWGDFDDCPFFVALVKAGGAGTYSCDTTHHYYEKGFDGADFLEAGMDEDESAYQILQPGLDAELSTVEDKLDDLFGDAFHEIANELKNEIDHLTSDETIADWIRDCNPEWIDEWEEEHAQEAA